MAPKSAVTSPVQKSPPCHIPSAHDLEEQLANLAVHCQPQDHDDELQLKSSRKSSAVHQNLQQPTSSTAEAKASADAEALAEASSNVVVSDRMENEASSSEFSKSGNPNFVLSQPPPRRRQASEGIDTLHRNSMKDELKPASKTLPLPPKSQITLDLVKRASPCPSTSSSVVDDAPPQVPPRRSSREYGSQNLYQHSVTSHSERNRSPSPKSPAPTKSLSGENTVPPRPPKPPGMSRFPSLASVRSPLPPMDEESDLKAPPLPPKPGHKHKVSEVRPKVEQIYDAPPLPPKPSAKLK
ncbi:unnamed protein product [Bursaphelenchus okinawaensis]|uniref:Uncharacterized protein n=1 Tax=Bursaphelenchus okinawaensis TaxID=465554 RepID=A0A811L6E2_9BILA|nr:unnamed protein product [Bursaphelenchus okinawaensis]CAG9118457.1 unnamed protein product [Bursaphelenchus okinawaensis]